MTKLPKHKPNHPFAVMQKETINIKAMFMNKRILLIVSGIFYAFFSYADSLPTLKQMINRFPLYDNFQYTCITRFQQYYNPEDITESIGKICYYKSSQATDYDYSYHIDYLSGKTDLVLATLIYDSMNYLRLHHDNQTYVLGENNYPDIQTYWGNIFAIKSLLTLLQDSKSIKYTITSDKKSGNILIEFTSKASIDLEVPVKLRKDENIKENQIILILNKETYFPISYTLNTKFIDGKSQVFQHIYNKPEIIAYKSIVAADSIPTGYQQINKNETNSEVNLIGSKFPAYQLKSLLNEEYSNKKVANKIVLYDLFSLYCGPCKMSTDDLIALKNEFQIHNFEIISIDVLKEPKLDKLIEYKNLKGVNYPIILRGDELQKALGIVSIPAFILVDGDNTIIYNEIGYSKEIMQNLKRKIEIAVKNK